MILNRLLAWGSVLGAFLLLGYAARLITKNLPVEPAAIARVNPPTPPTLTSTSSGDNHPDQQSNRSEPHTINPSDRSTSQRYIGGIGIVEPAGEAIQIGTQVSGLVSQVLVVPGQFVKRDEPLFTLDDRAAKANLKIALANEAAAIAKLKELEGQIAPSRSKLAASQAMLRQSQADNDNMRQQYERAKQLATNISEEELEARRLANELSKARVSEAEARVGESQGNLELLASESAPTLEVQRAAITQAAANVALARTNLDLLTIRAPLDARVLQVKIRVGEFAAAVVLTNALMVLGVTDPLHVRVEIDETEIPRLRSGAKAYAAVRGRADQQVPLTFVRSEPFVVPKKSLSGSVSERVDTRVLQLIYSVEPQKLGATVGQQVDVFIEE